MASLRVGTCLSLSGRYARFGRQAAAGLETWRELEPSDVELRIVDDGSEPDRVAAALASLAAGCDLVLGPYSTGLTRAAGPVLDAHDVLLFNHGGAGDDVQAQRPGRIVSVLAPASRYAEPFVAWCAQPGARAPLWIARGRGDFSRQVATGALDAARRHGLAASELAAGAVSPPGPVAPWDLFSVGRFEDDVVRVRAARSAAHPPRTLGSVAAGVSAFAAAAGDPDGVYGIAQWSAKTHARVMLGPDRDAFLATYRSRNGAAPDYPAVQAAAAAAIAVHCARTAGSCTRPALWAAAGALRTTTLFGRFTIDPESGVQIGQRPLLLRWENGRPVPVPVLTQADA